MSKPKQRIIFDYSKCRYRDFDKKSTRFNNKPFKNLLISPLNDSLIFVYYRDGTIDWHKFYEQRNNNKDVYYYSTVLQIKARTKKALLRKLQRLKFPKDTQLEVDTRVYAKQFNDCNFTIIIKSEPINNNDTKRHTLQS